MHMRPYISSTPTIDGRRILQPLNQTKASIMNKIQLTLAASLALATQFASAQASLPLEGGLSANTFAMGSPIVSTAQRADVAAQGNEAARSLNSRSGMQNESERAINARFTSTVSREEVRAEALEFAREGDQQVFEGGEASASLGAIAEESAVNTASTRAEPSQQ
jgi:hypothetical protein